MSLTASNLYELAVLLSLIEVRPEWADLAWTMTLYSLWFIPVPSLRLFFWFVELNSLSNVICVEPPAVELSVGVFREIELFANLLLELESSMLSLCLRLIFELHLIDVDVDLGSESDLFSEILEWFEIGF